MKAWKPALAAIIAALIVFFLPLPYFISYPGDATSTEDLIEVSGGDKEPGTERHAGCSRFRRYPLGACSLSSW